MMLLRKSRAAVGVALVTKSDTLPPCTVFGERHLDLADPIRATFLTK